MKWVFSLFALTLATTNVFAEKIPAKDLQSYKDAVFLATKSQRYRITCYGSVTFLGLPLTAESAVRYADSAEVFPGLQPLILFHYNSDKSAVTTVSTTADYKEVVSIRMSLLITATYKENRGTLAKPDLVDVTTTEERVASICD